MERISSAAPNEYSSEKAESESGLTVAAVLEKETQTLESLVSEPAGREGDNEPRTQRRRTKKALLHIISFLALCGPVGTIESRAQNRFTATEDGSIIIDTIPETEPKKSAANKKKVEKLRKEVNNKKLNEKIAYLESVYGDAVKNFLFAVKLDQSDLAWGASKDLQDYYDTQFAGRYDFFWNKKEILKRAEARKGHVPIVSGFEQAGYTDKKILSILNETPPEFIENINEIQYVPVEKKAAAYSVAGEAEDVGFQGLLLNGGGRIIIYKTEKIGDEDELQRILTHEIIHEADWQSSHRLTMKERIEMFASVTKFLLDPRRQKSDYVDNKIPEEGRLNGWDEKEAHFHQARELWAESFEVNREWFTESKYGILKRKLGESIGALPDIRLVDEWLNHMNIAMFNRINVQNVSEDTEAARNSFVGHLRNPHR